MNSFEIHFIHLLINNSYTAYFKTNKSIEMLKSFKIPKTSKSITNEEILVAPPQVPPSIVENSPFSIKSQLNEPQQQHHQQQQPPQQHNSYHFKKKKFLLEYQENNESSAQ